MVYGLLFSFCDTVILPGENAGSALAAPYMYHQEKVVGLPAARRDEKFLCRKTS